MAARITLPGAVAVVTGAGSGIGRATALELARRGADVVAVDLDELTAKVTAAACADLGVRSLAYAGDVADRCSLTDVRDQLRGDWARPVDLLVNNAGVGMTGRFLVAAPEDWGWIRSINLDGVINGCQVFVPEMLEHRSGHVVNVASGLAVAPLATTAAYSTTKAAVLMFSRAVRPDWAQRRVGVSVVLPGVTNTNIITTTRFAGAMDSASVRSAASRGFRFGHAPETVARAIVRAVTRNRAVVPVGVESHAAWYLAKVLPQSVIGVLGTPMPDSLGRAVQRIRP